jgi:GNAT superfamily N-acetyltransferase
MCAITPIAEPPPTLRAEYLDGLPQPQELFVENLVATGTCWSIGRDDRQIGYAVIHGAETLVELHVRTAELRCLVAAFEELAGACGVRRILAKSFDPTLMFVALLRPRQVRTTGLLYRVIVDPGFAVDAVIGVRAATPNDLAPLLGLGADFFDGPAEIEDYTAAGGLMIYEAADGVPLGAGVMKRVVPGRDDVDIGMVVDPGRRRRGHGAYIIAHLKAHCLARGWRPICGCAVDNLASRRTLERAGFASRHGLVEFELSGSPPPRTGPARRARLGGRPPGPT